MKNIVLILFLAMLSNGCKHEVNDEASDKEPAKVSSDHNRVSAIKVMDNYERGIVKSFLSEVSDGSVIDEMKVPASKVDIVYMEYSPAKDNTRLTGVSAPTEFEALLSKDTLYLKFFERSAFTEAGVRVKVVSSNFSISNYLVKDHSEIFHEEMITPQPYAIIENYVREMEPQKQSISLNKKKYEVGDTILGEIYYEGRQDFNVLYAKGQFSGIVREGKQLILTPTKKY
ncbi:hypothetical protein H9Q13_09970 [Pontibacter sp. JH31]|uniref:Lipoprotein n=1 Tax=Pontibacter aquaedesilientis TaxID=2766980 RepID=A0ABR7XGV0_9BACT|nr:hypothetical protein [Pontibacter aquaedesilientis]MBD1397493.1 hypothetical protein [Pontibacter aquaedesilientis]